MPLLQAGSTGEGHTLSRDEFVEAMEATHEAIAGRVPFLVGLIVNSTMEAVARTQKIAHFKPDALQVTPVHYLFTPGEEATIRHFCTIYDETGVPVLIYNVVPWNYLSIDMMLKIMDEIPGVIGMKQSAGNLKTVSDLVMRIREDNIVLSAVDALLYPDFALGQDGAISALTSALPKHTVELYQAVQAGDHARGLELHWQFAALWNSLEHDNLPALVKYIQSRQGLAPYPPRAPMEQVGDAQKHGIDAALKNLGL